MSHWSDSAIFYHIYPLGLCGAPRRNDFTSQPVDRLRLLEPWLDHIRDLGANALYLGPLFESSSHGYDTADYTRVDRRLGTGESLARFSSAAHAKGMRIIFDGVFNHVGRDFWAFRDLLANGERSEYASWFHSLAFGKKSPFGDPFSYEGWNGHFDLVKLNLASRDVREHIFGAIDSWVRDYGIDGLRLDAADVMDMDFLRALSEHCKRSHPDFWLLGEVVHGDYRRWANPQTLDSVTNYECYKGLYSSHVDKNYFEIAYSLNRQFGPTGLYQGLKLYSFADNHDVNRVASMLKESRHLHALSCLLFTMPGIPSIYYGSEWGIDGKKDGTDWPLRPSLDLDALSRASPHPELPGTIRRLARIRQESAPLRAGDYVQLHVSHELLAFAQRAGSLIVVVVVNASGEEASVRLRVPAPRDGRLVDVLNPGDEFPLNGGTANVDPCPRGGPGSWRCGEPAARTLPRERAVQFLSTAGDGEHDPFADVADAVSHALQVVRHPGEPVGLFRGPGVRLHEPDELAVGLLIEGVHDVVFPRNGPGLFNVLAHERVQRPMKHVARRVRHPGNVLQRFDEGLFSQHQRDVGNPLGVVRDAFKLGCDLENGRQRAKVSRHGLLGGNDRERLILDGIPLLVDHAVFVHDGLGLGQVPLLERLDRLRHRALRHGSQGEYLVFQPLKVVFELFPRHSSTPWTGPLHPERPVM